MESSPRPAPESEGTTIGRNSRDTSQQNIRANRNQRTSSGGGFLLDSVHPTNLRHGQQQHTHRAHATDSEKRRQVDDEIIVSKRRATPDRGIQPQRRRSLRTSPLAAVTNVSNSEGHDSSQNESATSRHASRNSYASSTVGLDTDQVQIVNLALNLSESRRRATANAGRVPSSPLPGLRHSSLYPQDNRLSRNIGPLPQSLPHGSISNNHGVAGMLPISDLQDVDIACSQATLARIEKAKQHFELFSKYLELLSYLPPLQPSDSVRSTSGRAYNPLQAIRNRKIRMREKNPNIDPEGWQDVSKVEDWLASVKAAKPQNNNDPYQCIALPPFQDDRDGGLVEQQESLQTASSPSSSIRGLNRSNTTKMQRPRLEWVISPAELLADAVWVESGTNKSKIYDRDGEKLYPDPSKLKFAGSPAIQNVEATENRAIPTEPSNLPNFANKREARASHMHQLKPSNGLAFGGQGDYAPKWTRSSSVSDDSSSDDMISRGRARRISRKAKMKAEAAMQAEKLHRVLHGHSDSSNAGSRRSKTMSRTSSVKAGDVVDKTHMLASPAGSVTGREEHRMSLDEMDSTAPNSPAQGPIFPSITANLSPPSSRSPSPQKRLPRIMETLHEKAKPRRHGHSDHGERLDESPSADPQLRKRLTADSSNTRGSISPRALEPSLMPETPLGQDEMSLDTFHRSESLGSFKPYANNESRLKGFLKNSRIAEIVGSEVSKVGDMIRRKDGGGHSRQSSYASSIESDLRDSDEDRSEGELTPSKRNQMRRGSTFSDNESGLSSRKTNGRTSTKTFFSNLPSIGSSFRGNYQDEPAYFDRLHPESSRVSDVHFVRAHPDLAPPSSVDTTPYIDRRDSYGFGSAPHPARRTYKERDDEITPSAALPGGDVPLRPPVTGLANAETSKPDDNRNSNRVRPTLSTGSRGWSLSDRSIPTMNDTNLLHKREILRCQALLLSSGVKANEIVQRYETPREHSSSSPPTFLIKSLVDPKAPIPHSLPRIDEFNYAARNLLERLENTKTGLNKSIYLFSKTTLLPLEKEIDILEDFITNHLTPRVRSAALEAETLSTRLNTTSTLEIKQLSDTLDKGLRRRNRRLRSIRRIGFSLLEWTLVGVMWWLWLIVMVFNVLRGIGKGVVKGVRWILWV
ncbi:conserved hypothetical protein [Talaromyces stipitatus ATCC 10500]|uniref:Uncharacterized protein n=1 Tax=Talaromyces stipitatus (strain ATCC 10500 / CBS 375.48 / QM 6759 / NRRL 1006) TaxID=441959 RepID=B8MJK4_TALSN|nr:uncharacterized protein TSTA_046580 [Talaromyces stipitatus ATCC 10500]EED15204.1 conserved hypothetical protein [Talaromyces stipitatus ATCC 10500]